MIESLHVETLELWQEVICTRILEGECSQVRKKFHADIAVNRPSDIQFSHIGSQSHLFERTNKHIRHSSQEFFVVVLQVRGSAVLSQEGREVLVRPGELTCNDTTRPSRLHLSDESEQVVVHMPRALAMGNLGPTQRFTALRMGKNSCLGSVLVPFLKDVAAAIDRVSTEVAANLSQTAVSLIMTSLAEQSETRLKDPNWPRNALLYRAERFVRGHSRNHGLNSAVVATALNTSLRYLQDVFHETERTPTEYIWECRLRNCEQDLINPCLNSLSIGEIALRGGFRDPGHFSRSFRQFYGMSPRDYRANEQRRLARETGLS